MKKNKLITISEGSSRLSKSWKPVELDFYEFAERLKTPIRTAETFQEYQQMSRDEKGQIKDVGGFVGGILSGHRRKAENVESRELITLDIDNLKQPVEEFWGMQVALGEYAMVLYTTHSHSPDKPRVRLILPMTRPVSPDEYEAIARSVANDIDIEVFDNTTFAPERLMYWPSVAKDAEYIYEFEDGEWIDPDAYLAEHYRDWTDRSSWPGIADTDKRIAGGLKRQEDPLTKKGVIGAYCQTYSITELMETELQEVYDPTSHEGRYTYKGGSTTGGVVVYEDKWVYSHHSTDPISGQLVNAFDLIRIHHYRDLDENVKEGTPTSSLPSFKRMRDVVLEDDRVKPFLVAQQRMDEDDLDFEGEENDWVKKLSFNKQGVPESTIRNALLVLENHPELKGRVYYDDFLKRAVVKETLPWSDKADRDWSDSDDSGIREFLESKYHITGVQKISDAVSLLYEKNSVHPVREYLNSLEWDGMKRVETILHDYLGAENSEYTHSVAKMHLVAAVARVMRPGIKYDNVLSLVGKQGIGKTTFIALLCGREWFNDSIERINGKETFEQLQGSWHIEFGEMNATRKADKEAVKQFLSKTEDIYRVAYGRHTSRFPRQCVFWSTGNDAEFLRDETGDRRYLPVTCGVVAPRLSVFEHLTKERDQIWAEAVALYKKGYPLYLSADQEKVANEIRQEHKEDRPLVGLIRSFLDTPIPVNWYQLDHADKMTYLQTRRLDEDFLFDEEEELMQRDKTCVMEIWVECMENKKGNISKMQSAEISSILRSMEGWKPSNGSLRFGELGRQKAYVRESPLDTMDTSF